MKSEAALKLPSGRVGRTATEPPHIGRTSPAGTNGVDQFQLAIGSIDGEGADCALFVLAHAVRLVSGVKVSPCGVQNEAARTGSKFIDTAWNHDPGGAIDLKEMDATSVSGRPPTQRKFSKTSAWKRVIEWCSDGAA